MAADALLTVNNIEVVYNKTVQVLRGLSLTVDKGAVVALLGSNGAGKSTTLKAVSNLLELEDGKVTEIDIAPEEVGVPRATLYGWMRAEGWADAPAVQRVECSLETRLVTLIAKDAKTGGDFKEIDLLGRQMERLARIGKYEQTGREADLNPAIEARNAGPKKRRPKNFLSDEQVEQLKSAFLDGCFKYQLQ